MTIVTQTPLATLVFQELEAIKMELIGHHKPGWVRRELTFPSIDILEWFVAQPHSQKCYWSYRERWCQVAGIGFADDVSGDGRLGVDQLRTRLKGAPAGIRYFGGGRFDVASRVSPEWEQFGGYRFVVSQFECMRDAGGTKFFINFYWDGTSNLDQEIEKWMRVAKTLVFECPDLPEGTMEPGVTAPDRDQWLETAEKIIQEIKLGYYQKLVLARKQTHRLSEPWRLVKRWVSEATATDRTHYGFVFQVSKENVFFGRSPELLIHRDGRHIKSEALAGTRSRGVTAEEDRELEGALKFSQKEQTEHRIVADYIRDVLSDRCDHVYPAEDPTVRKLPRLQHLYTPMEGHLLEPFSDDELIEALHPTPAVAGLPIQDAVDRIRGLEPFDRGWYAGPMGWVSADHVQLIVAIRSGLYHGPEVSFYAGAGLVSASNPETEWQEIENKLNQTASLAELTYGHQLSYH